MNKLVQEYVAKRKEELKNLIKDKEVFLTVIQVGNNPASNSYIKGKEKDCEEVGIIMNHLHFAEDVDQAIIMQAIDIYNLDEYCHGIIVQLPLPPHLDVKKIQLAIDPKKDVDGFHPMSHFKPCTPMGVVNYLKANGYKFESKNALVIGRSDIVGKPLAQLLTDLDCTVTLAHSKTKDTMSYLKDADIVFTAIDKIEWFERHDFLYNEPDVIIDIGLGVSKRDNKLHGNLSEECVKRLKSMDVEVVSGIGGVGLLTRLQLLENTIQASGL